MGASYADILSAEYISYIRNIYGYALLFFQRDYNTGNRKHELKTYACPRFGIKNDYPLPWTVLG